MAKFGCGKPKGRTYQVKNNQLENEMDDPISHEGQSKRHFHLALFVNIQCCRAGAGLQKMTDWEISKEGTQTLAKFDWPLSVISCATPGGNITLFFLDAAGVRHGSGVAGDVRM